MFTIVNIFHKLQMVSELAIFAEITLLVYQILHRITFQRNNVCETAHLIIQQMTLPWRGFPLSNIMFSQTVGRGRRKEVR